jgi:hypothetical protein
MKDDIKQNRICTVLRFMAGEKPEAICSSLGCQECHAQAGGPGSTPCFNVGISSQL